MRRWLLTRRFFLALLVGVLVMAAAGVIMKIAGLGDDWRWVAFLVALFAASLVDREGFYGTPPRERH